VEEEFSRFTAAWDITKACNFACVHCISGAGKRWPVSTICSEDAHRIIRQIGELGITSLAWSGGEPLLREDLFSIMHHGRKYGVEGYSLVTNGYLIDEQLAGRMVDAGMTHVQISIDGVDAKANRFLRKGPKDCFARAVEAIGICLKAGLRVSLGTMLYPGMIGSLDRIYQLALRLGVDRLRFSAFAPNGRGERAGVRQLFDFSFEEMTELLLFLRDRFFERPGYIMLDTAFSMNPWIGRFSHSEGQDYFFIDYKGDLFPSTSMERPEYRVGNVLQEPLRELLHHPALVPPLPAREELSGKCRECELFDTCRGGSRGIAFMFSGSFLTSPELCLYHEYRLRGWRLDDVVLSRMFSPLSDDELGAVVGMIDRIETVRITGGEAPDRTLSPES
jgi:radical SAM protein with 4Fe4S-binding SPASM domain